MPSRPSSRTTRSRAAPPAPRRKRAGDYHHGNLREALLGQALATIRAEGVEALTLRGVGEHLGVSRTALYRHFADKSALLQAVATDGFRRFRAALQTAWDGAGGGLAGLQAMGVAYVQFAVANPSHYRVMFGGYLGPHGDPELHKEGAAAFDVLMHAIVALQQSGDLRVDDPLLMSRYVWSVTHGIALLSLDVPLNHPRLDAAALATYGVQRLSAGLRQQ